jgi:hypothetical protein
MGNLFDFRDPFSPEAPFGSSKKIWGYKSVIQHNYKSTCRHIIIIYLHISRVDDAISSLCFKIFQCSLICAQICHRVDISTDLLLLLCLSLLLLLLSLPLLLVAL